MKNSDDEKNLPIRFISQATGILPVTLRAWERRYGLIKPARTEKGHRLYAQSDITLIRQILGLISQGVPVGKTRQLINNPDAIKSTSSDWPQLREQLLLAVYGLHSDKAIEIVRRAGKLYPLPSLAAELIEPALHLIEQSADTKRWAYHQLLTQTVNIYMDQRSHQAQIANSRPGPIFITSLLSDSPALQARLFEIMARESGLDARWLGHAPGPLALAELLLHHNATGVILWEENEVAGDWQPLFSAIKHAVALPIAVGGRFSLYQARNLQQLLIPLLPQEHDTALKMIRSWY